MIDLKEKRMNIYTTCNHHSFHPEPFQPLLHGYPHRAQLFFLVLVYVRVLTMKRNLNTCHKRFLCQDSRGIEV